MLQTQCYNGARGAVTKKKLPALDKDEEPGVYYEQKS